MEMLLNKVKISAKELKYFTAFFVFICLLKACPFTAWVFRPALTLTLAYGLIMLVRFFWQGKGLFKRPLFLLLFLFSAIYCINILVHFHDGLSVFVTNGGQLTLACLYFFIFFFQFSMLESEDRGEILRFSFDIFILGTLLISIISLVMLLFRYGRYCYVGEVAYRIGLHTRGSINGVFSYQLCGIGTSSSILGTICAVASFVSLTALWLNGKRHQRFYIISTVIFVLTLCAANAFTSALMVMVFAASYVGCHYLTAASSLHGARFAKRIFKLIVLMLCTLFFIYVLYYALQGAEASVVNLFERIRAVVSSTASRIIALVIPSAEDSGVPGIFETAPGAVPGATPGAVPGATPGAATETPPIAIERTLTSSIYSGRFPIWIAGFQKFLEHPILGVTNENASVYVDDRLYDNLHNGYLMLLVGTGIIGFTLIVFFGLRLLIKALRFISTHSGDDVKHLSLLISVCLAILALDLVNGNFVFAPSYSYIFLWLFLGEIYSIVYLDRPPITRIK